jgi:hypothetical protein
MEIVILAAWAIWKTINAFIFQIVTRVNSINILDEGLRIGEIGHRMNSKVNQSNKVCIESKHGDELGLLSICPSPSSPGPYI